MMHLESCLWLAPDNPEMEDGVEWICDPWCPYNQEPKVIGGEGMIYSLKDCKVTIGDGPHTGELARPLWTGTIADWKARVRAAWAVMRGEAVAVRWYS